jgi:polyhydroxyalkanoate synthesis regulator phasin
MAGKDMFQRYLEAGTAFTEMTRARAEGIVKELVKAGEVQLDQVQSLVDELVERRRRNTDQLLTMIRKEVATQLSQLGLATREDLDALEQRVNQKLANKKAPPKKVAAKKVAASQANPSTTVRPAKKAGKAAKAAKASKAADKPQGS